MKRVGFLFGVLCLFWLVGCQDRDDLLNEKVVEENREYLIREVTKKFFTVDTVKYQQLKRDAGFVELCEYYEAMEKRVMAGMRERLHKIETRKWFEKMDWAIEDYQCDNLFAYMLRYLNEKENLSRISHSWGPCYYNGVTAVCDTYGHWQDFWGLNKRMELSALEYMGSNMDLLIYRNSYIEYQFVYDDSMFAFQYCTFYQNEVLNQGPYCYITLQNWPLSTVTHHLISVYAIPQDYVCYFIGEWEKAYMRFYNSRLWIMNHAEAGLFPSHDVGSGGSSSVILSPEMIEVIDSSDFEGYKFISCVFASLQKNYLFDRLIKEFRDSIPQAHLRYEVTNNLPEGTNARLRRNMENYWLTIEINANLEKRPPLIIAKTIIHETIHAHIIMQLLNVQDTWGKANLTEHEFACLQRVLTDEDYPTLYYYYNKYKNHTTAQHQYMSEYYVEYIADILFGIGNMSYVVCEAIAWQGLKETKVPGGTSEETEAWKKLSSDEQIAIDDAYKNYLRNIAKCLE